MLKIQNRLYVLSALLALGSFAGVASYADPAAVAAGEGAGKTASPTARPIVDKVFYVYSDKGDPRNHFAPSGWMGDYGDLKLDEANTEKPAQGKTAMKWNYSGQGRQGAHWAGVFWQNPPNNWGSKPGGYDLSKYKKVIFQARGANGGEKVEFKVGGITGENGDSDSATTGPTELTKDWKTYTIDLADKNMSHIIGGFCWVANHDDNPNGVTLYLDNIRYE